MKNISDNTSNIVGVGAEAILIREKDILKKIRIRKGYRNEKIDESLRKLRTRKEGKILEKLSKLDFIPKLHKINELSKEISMDFIDGERLSETLDGYNIKKQKEIARIIGKNISILHSLNIIHGDLTTSNMLLVKSNKNNLDKIYFIDFGLSFESRRIEDKAVDLRLIKQAVYSKHFKTGEQIFKEILEGYKEYKENKEANNIIIHLENVENRGRYKQKQKRRKIDPKKQI